MLVLLKLDQKYFLQCSEQTFFLSSGIKIFDDRRLFFPSVGCRSVCFLLGVRSDPAAYARRSLDGRRRGRHNTHQLYTEVTGGPSLPSHSGDHGNNIELYPSNYTNGNVPISSGVLR